MSVLSTSLRNEIASQKDIFRLAATIYSETSDVVSDAEAQTHKNIILIALLICSLLSKELLTKKVVKTLFICICTN